VGLVVGRLPQLGIVRVSRWCFNCYLIDGDDGLIVVDAGFPTSQMTWRRLWRTCLAGCES
jgi:hypothetical protein